MIRIVTVLSCDGQNCHAEIRPQVPMSHQLIRSLAREELGWYAEEPSEEIIKPDLCPECRRKHEK